MLENITKQQFCVRLLVFLYRPFLGSLLSFFHMHIMFSSCASGFCTKKLESYRRFQICKSPGNNPNNKYSSWSVNKHKRLRIHATQLQAFYVHYVQLMYHVHLRSILLLGSQKDIAFLLSLSRTWNILKNLDESQQRKPSMKLGMWSAKGKLNKHS